MNSTADATNEQREAIRAYVRRDLMPLIESVLVKRLSMAAVFLRDELNKPASGVEGIDGPRHGPVADGSQKPNDAAAIPCVKAGSNPGAKETP